MPRTSGYSASSSTTWAARGRASSCCSSWYRPTQASGSRCGRRSAASARCAATGSSRPTDAPTELRQELRLPRGVLDLLLGAPVDFDALVGDRDEIAAPRGVAIPSGADSHRVLNVAAALATGDLAVIGVWGRDEAAREATVRAVAGAAGLPLRRLRGPWQDAAQAAAALGALLWVGVDTLAGEESQALADAIAACRVPVCLAGARPWRPAAILAARPYAEVELRPLDPAQRHRLWADALPELAEDVTSDLAASFRIGMAEVRAAASMARTEARVGGNGRPLPLEQVVHASSSAVARRRSYRFATVITPRRTAEDLVLPAELEGQVLEIASFFRAWPRICRTWGFGGAASHQGVRALFSGEPGTGKTLAAEVIAGELELDLLKVDLSRVVSKWVGETEKNLEAVFAEAEDEPERAVLRRGRLAVRQARRGPPRRRPLRQPRGRLPAAAAGAFEGLVVLATNLRQSLDDAFTRRFRRDPPVPAAVAGRASPHVEPRLPRRRAGRRPGPRRARAARPDGRRHRRHGPQRGAAGRGGGRRRDRDTARRDGRRPAVPAGGPRAAGGRGVAVAAPRQATLERPGAVPAELDPLAPVAAPPMLDPGVEDEAALQAMLGNGALAETTPETTTPEATAEEAPMPPPPATKPLAASVQAVLVSLLGEPAAALQMISDEAHDAELAAERAPAAVCGEAIVLPTAQTMPATATAARALLAAARNALAGVDGPIDPTAPVPPPGYEEFVEVEAVAAPAEEVPTEAVPAEAVPAEEAPAPAPEEKPAPPGEVPAPEAEALGAAVAPPVPSAPVTERPGFELLMPPAPSAASPAQTERLEQAKHRAAGASRSAARLPSARTTTDEARAAVKEPKEEIAAHAREDLATALGKNPPPNPSIDDLCKEIRAAIKARRPVKEKDLTKADMKGVAQQVGQTLDKTVDANVEGVHKGYATLEHPPEGQAKKTPTPLGPPPPPLGEPKVGADAAVPDPIPPENLSLEADQKQVTQRVEESGINRPTTEPITEPPFATVREGQADLDQLAKETPAQLAAKQQQAIADAQTSMAELQAQAVQALRESRADTVASVGGGKKKMVGTEEEKRAQFSKPALKIFSDTQKRVNEIVTPLPGRAKALWRARVDAASEEFKTTLAGVQAWIDDRHSGIGGWFAEKWDNWTGLPGWVTRDYNKAEQRFGDLICKALKDISADVDTDDRRRAGADRRRAHAHRRHLHQGRPARAREMGGRRAREVPRPARRPQQADARDARRVRAGHVARGDRGSHRGAAAGRGATREGEGQDRADRRRDRGVHRRPGHGDHQRPAEPGRDPARSPSGRSSTRSSRRSTTSPTTR